jgi:hypothetical protein
MTPVGVQIYKKVFSFILMLHLLSDSEYYQAFQYKIADLVKKKHIIYVVPNKTVYILF